MDQTIIQPINLETFNNTCNKRLFTATAKINTFDTNSSSFNNTPINSPVANFSNINTIIDLRTMSNELEINTKSDDSSHSPELSVSIGCDNPSKIKLHNKLIKQKLSQHNPSISNSPSKSRSIKNEFVVEPRSPTLSNEHVRPDFSVSPNNSQTQTVKHGHAVNANKEKHSQTQSVSHKTKKSKSANKRKKRKHSKTSHVGSHHTKKRKVSQNKIKIPSDAIEPRNESAHSPTINGPSNKLIKNKTHSPTHGTVLIGSNNIGARTKANDSALHRTVINQGAQIDQLTSQNKEILNQLKLITQNQSNSNHSNRSNHSNHQSKKAHRRLNPKEFLTKQIDDNIHKDMKTISNLVNGRVRWTPQNSEKIFHTHHLRGSGTCKPYKSWNEMRQAQKNLKQHMIVHLKKIYAMSNMVCIVLFLLFALTLYQTCVLCNYSLNWILNYIDWKFNYGNTNPSNQSFWIKFNSIHYYYQLCTFYINYFFSAIDNKFIKFILFITSVSIFFDLILVRHLSRFSFPRYHVGI